ncbi:hypothetical protein EB061_05205 [bacterium]|jgi:hypothetical protein|nr:hypothetical protein [bacterium]
MSQSLNRIRSLVSEIEQIQKQGQRVSRAAPRLDLASGPMEEEPSQDSRGFPEPATQGQATTENIASQSRSEFLAEPRAETQAEQASPAEPTARMEPLVESRVTVQWSGNLVLELLLPQNAEKIEMKQIGDWIEIRFSDGKAFHIPFKAVA